MSAAHTQGAAHSGEGRGARTHGVRRGRVLHLANCVVRAGTRMVFTHNAYSGAQALGGGAHTSQARVMASRLPTIHARCLQTHVSSGSWTIIHPAVVATAAAGMW